MADNRTVKVTLKAEIASYVAQMLRSGQATKDLGSAATAAGNDIERALAQSEKAADSSSQSFDRLGKVTKTTLAAMVLGFGAYGAALIHQGIQANSFAEQSEVALTTMLGSADAAKAALDEVYNLATETPFQFPVLTDQFKVFAAARMELSQIIPLMHAYSSAVAALGGGNDKLEQVADAFAKIQALGKADADQLNSLALAGIPVWEMLAEEAGKSTSQVREDVSANLYDANRAITVLTAGMEGQFGGMLNSMGDTYARWQDRVSSAQRRTAQALTDPLMDAGKQVLASITGMLNQTTAVLKSVDDEEWAAVLEPIQTLPEIIDKIASRISEGGLEKILDGVHTGLELVATAAELAVNVAMPLVDVMGLATQAGIPLLQLMTALVGGFNDLPGPVQAGIAALALIGTLNGPYSRMVTAINGTVTATRAAMAEQMRYQAVLHTGSVLNGTAASSVSRLSLAWGAAKTSALGLATGARAAGAAIMTAFGGPVGLGIAAVLTAATVATSIWTDQQQKAEEAARASEAAITAVSDALDQNTGAFTANARAMIAQGLMDADLPAYLDEIGVSMDEFSAALYGSEDAQEAFRQKLISLGSTDQMIDLLDRMGMSFEDFGDAALRMNRESGEWLGIHTNGLRDIAGAGGFAAASLELFDNQIKANEASVEQFGQKAALAGDAANFHATPTVDTSQAESALASLQQRASSALASFISWTPQKKKSGGGGGGGGGSKGEDPEVKRLKAEQKEIKKRTDAEKKAAAEYEKLMQKRAQAAEDAARKAEQAATDAANAEEAALDKSKRAADAYVSAQRQRMAIQRTLDAETDPVRRKALQQALADAIDYEREMLDRKTQAEKEAAAATVANTEAQQRAKDTVAESAQAQKDYELASAAAAETQERAAAAIEAAAERLAAATEASADRASSAMSGASEDVQESLREWLDRIWEQIEAQQQWADNMAWLAQNTTGSVVSMFLKMGQDGAYLLDELRNKGTVSFEELEAAADQSAGGTYEKLISGIQLVADLYPELVAKFGKKAADELSGAVATGATNVDDILSTLKVKQEGQKWTLDIDADTENAMRQTNSIVSYINAQRGTVEVEVRQVARESWKGRFPGHAAGGAITGSGPKGKDSVPIMAAPGEHMLTAQDVDAMGGQAGVYEFRRRLHKGWTPDVSAQVAGSSSAGEPRYVVYQTVHYPIAEPASKAAIRSIREEVG